MRYYDKLVFELSRKGRSGFSLPDCNSDLPSGGVWRETAPDLPEVSEPDVVRHYTNLSQMNFGVDTGFYPLGSCTMKYNPKINEEIAADPTVARLHPAQPADFEPREVVGEENLRNRKPKVTEKKASCCML